MNGYTVTGGQVLAVLAVLLVVVLVAVAGRVLLAAAVIVAAQWAVITYWPGNATLLWVVLAVPALLAGYTLAGGAHRQHRARHQLAPSPGRCTAMTTAMTTGYGGPLIITGVVLVWSAGRWCGRPVRAAGGWLVRSRVWRAR
jgi:hypothetical protein